MKDDQSSDNKTANKDGSASERGPFVNTIVQIQNAHDLDRKCWVNRLEFSFNVPRSYNFDLGMFSEALVGICRMYAVDTHMDHRALRLCIESSDSEFGERLYSEIWERLGSMARRCLDDDEPSCCIKIGSKA